MPRAALLSLHARVDRCRVVDLGGSLARPALGASLQHLRRPQARLRAVLAGEASRQRQGPAAGRAHCRAAARPARRRTHDGPRGRARARRQPELVPVRRDDRHGRHPLGRRTSADRLDRRPPRRSTRPTRAASSLDATSTSSGRPRPTASPAGQASREEPRPPRSPRSKGRSCRFERHSATSGCSRDDEPAVRAPETASAPARLLPSGDTYFLLAGEERELLIPRADQRQRLWTSRVWPGALLVEGEIRGTWRRAQHTVRDRRLDTPLRVRRAMRSRPRPAACRFRALDREIEVVWDA